MIKLGKKYQLKTHNLTKNKTNIISSIKKFNGNDNVSSIITNKIPRRKETTIRSK